MSTTRRLVLAGGGHAHLEVLRRAALAPDHGFELTLISPGPTQVYSGMVPGYLAGQYSLEEISVSLERLAQRAGAQLISDRLARIDLDRRSVSTASGRPIDFDLLSLNIGSRARQGTRPDVAAHALVAKPFDRIETIRAALEDLAERSQARVCVVGAGAAGVELAFAARAALARRQAQPSIRIVEAEPAILRGERDRTRRRVRAALESRGIELLCATRVTRVAPTEVTFETGARAPVELVLWITGAEPSVDLTNSGLLLDASGFVCVRDTLQSVTDSSIFAVGDCAALVPAPAVAKAGVYAVRQAPVLWENLNRIARGEPLRTFHPQKSFLALLNCCDGKALVRYKWFTGEATWAWRLKDSIDRRFLRRYRD